MMERRNFIDILQSVGVNLEKEYSRLYDMFYGSGIRESVEQCFFALSFTGTCVSLDDFDETYNFCFDRYPRDFGINYLVSFCEYSYNLVKGVRDITLSGFLNQIEKVIALIGYIKIARDGISIFVEKSKAATSVSEIVPSALAYETLEYNHHNLKGNLEEKKRILVNMSNYIEPKQQALNGISKQLKSDLFYLFNNYNIRHNNCELGKNHNPVLDNMSANDLEKIYDDTYQIWLLSVLELDNLEREIRIKALREKQGN